MAPEACQNQPVTDKSDVWALGCILFELCTLKHPFEAENLLGLVLKIVSEKHGSIPSQYSSDMIYLIDRLLEKDPAKRPKVKEILQFPFVTERMKIFIQKKGKLSDTQQHKLFRRQITNSHHNENLLKKQESIKQGK